VRNGVALLSLGKDVIDITGSLTVCYTFTEVMFDLVVSNLLDLEEEILWRPTKWAKGLAFVTYGYVVLPPTIIHLTLGNLAISRTVSVYKGILPYEFVTIPELIDLS
jgi:hypothetical protein